MELLLNFILSVATLVIIYVIIKSVLKKNVKDIKLGFGFFKGFEFSCSFFENTKTKQCQ